MSTSRRQLREMLEVLVRSYETAVNSGQQFHQACQLVSDHPHFDKAAYDEVVGKVGREVSRWETESDRDRFINSLRHEGEIIAAGERVALLHDQLLFATGIIQQGINSLARGPLGK